MSSPISTAPAYRGPALFSYGFRPLFLGAALFAGIAVPVWVLLAIHLGTQAPRDWHVHEMVFGFLPAVVAGFILTAMPNWTDRPPIRGGTLAALVVLWLAGRAMNAVGLSIPPIFAVLDAAFLLALATLVWKELAAARAWDRAPLAALISLYAAADLSFHALGLNGEPIDLAARMGLAVMMLLLALIGGRVIPAFTAEFLATRGRTPGPSSCSPVDGASILLVALAALSWTVSPGAAPTGWMLIAAGLLNVVRLGRWRGWATWEEPLVAVLHVGYAWLAVSLLVMGSAVLGAALAKEDAVHALTTGAVGVMTLGIMTRATLGHTGRPRHAGPATVVIYILVNVGALVRTFGPLTDVQPALVLGVAGACWSGAYLLFVAVYGSMLVVPSLDD